MIQKHNVSSSPVEAGFRETVKSVEQIHERRKTMKAEGRGRKSGKEKSVFRPGLAFCGAHAGSGIEGGSGFFSLPLFFDRKRPRRRGRVSEGEAYVKGRHRPVCNSSNHWKEACGAAVRFGVREEDCGSVVLCSWADVRPAPSSRYRSSTIVPLELVINCHRSRRNADLSAASSATVAPTN